jgi:DNA-3-methyladenine glycosylase II
MMTSMAESKSTASSRAVRCLPTGVAANGSMHASGPDTRPDRRLRIKPAVPFRLDLTAWALRRRAHNGVDRWDGRVYSRALSLNDGAVVVSVAQSGPPDTPRLSVTIAGEVADQRAEALVRSSLSKLLGLTVDLSGFAAMAAEDDVLRDLAGRMRGFKPPRFPTVFEALVTAIACQQLSLVVGVHLVNRLAATYGRPLSGAPDRHCAFPGPRELASIAPHELRKLGFSLTKGRTIIEIAQATVAGDLDLESLERFDDQAVIERLTSLRGVGRWTAEYVMLRGLGRLHVFPGDDVGARNKLERFLAVETQLDYEGVARVLARWRPYAGIIYLHLLLDSLSETGLVTA